MTPFKKDAANERETSQHETQDTYIPRDPAWLRREPVKREDQAAHQDETSEERKAS